MAAVISQETMFNMRTRQEPPPSWLDVHEAAVVLDQKEAQDFTRTFENDVMSTVDWTKCLIICTKYVPREVSLLETAPVPSLGIPIYDAGRVVYISTTECSNGGVQTHCLLLNDSQKPQKIHKLIMHKSSKYGDGPTLSISETETEYLASSALRGRMLEFLLYDRKKKELGETPVFTWKYVTLDGKKSLVMESGADGNKQLAKLERKGNKGQGTMRWTDASGKYMELWMNEGNLKAEGISEAVVVTSCLMILRAEIVRRFSIAAWLMGQDEDEADRVRVE
ncbi:hypothetical protein E2P81_ATG07269 [Venturia nashicola]|uniref:Uncharacterized protein n=1 Tax=Venturia nashicola TaxID=86259 RepID=A0A4Z1NXP5_9PEZI|nr:hypothetical protein E6O75_ATG07429 [Venturia nashicola]TLD31779.1 hypothetical protein E2P81_ATG07269 [Venturia nashicola]